VAILTGVVFLTTISRAVQWFIAPLVVQIAFLAYAEVRQRQLQGASYCHYFVSASAAYLLYDYASIAGMIFLGSLWLGQRMYSRNKAASDGTPSEISADKHAPFS
jgi:hypothetical protein